MQELIKEYGNSIISGVVFVLVVALIFTGLGLIFLTDKMAGVLDDGIIKAEAGDGEVALNARLQI